MLKQPEQRHLRIGDLIECAIWLSGVETEAEIKRWMDIDCPAALRGIVMQEDTKLEIGPVLFELKRPGDERVPQVPKHIAGPHVRLLVAEAFVVGLKLVRTTTFLQCLDDGDLARLRAVTRRHHAKLGMGELSDAECDRIIEKLGPGSAAQAAAGSMAVN